MSIPVPPSDGPEYLHSGGGQPTSPPGRGTRRTTLVTAGAVVGIAALGGGLAVAWSAFFATGPQPAQALPDSTIGYVSVDLDPSGSQKLAGLRTLQKFPAFEEEIGLDTDDDLRREIFNEIQNDAECAGVDYDDDVEPWLGNRFAIAAVETGADFPAFVAVVQVSDEQAAADGLTALKECTGANPDDFPSGDPSDDGEADQETGSGGWAISDGWAVIAETDEIAQQISDDAADSTLADDGEFRDWTEAAGDPGILSAYAAPEAGAVVAEQVERFPFVGGESCATLGFESLDQVDPEAGFEVDCDADPDPEAAGRLDRLADGFEGAALTVRFDDASLELETVTGTGTFGLEGVLGSDQGAEALSTLPDDTAAALGVGLEDGWFDDLLSTVADFAGTDVDLEEILEQAEAETGLSLPEDAETLAGDSAALSLGNDFDVEEFIDSDRPDGLPFALKIKGDGDEIEDVLEGVRSTIGEDDEVAALFDSARDGDYLVIGPDEDYRDQVLEDGDLGDSDVFADVMREADNASTMLFVNFDVVAGWLSSLADDDPEVADNLAPLSGLGVSAWVEDDVAHAVIRVTTE